jgi:hypothetical protein
MDIAVHHYNNHESTMINRCRLYLQVFSIYDIISYDGLSIHPNILAGERPPSRSSNKFWVEFRRPPKKYISLWKTFLETHILPIIRLTRIHWYTASSTNYTHSFFHSAIDNNLYQAIPEGYLKYLPKRTTTQETTYP